MASVTFGIAVLITTATILVVLSIGIGFYRRAQATATSGNWPAVSWVVNGFLTGWLLVAATLAGLGFFLANPAATGVPPIALALTPLLAGGVLFGLSPAFRQTIAATPLHWLIGVQVYRVLGAVFLLEYAQGQLPGVFALPAGIGDVLIGLTAPLVAYLVRTRHPAARPWAVVWNLAGLADLATALTLGFLSAPGRFQLFAFDAPNRLIGAFPFAMIPTILVPIAILLHLFALRGLRGQAPSQKEG